jgi:hypothetical protein
VLLDGMETCREAGSVEVPKLRSTATACLPGTPSRINVFDPVCALWNAKKVTDFCRANLKVTVMEAFENVLKPNR